MLADAPLRKSRLWCACCCLAKYRIWRTCCLVFTPFILVALAIIGYFFWPRLPRVNIEDISLADLSNSFAFDLAPNSSNYNTLTMQLRLKMNISCFNPNIYSIWISQLQLYAYLDVNKTEITSHTSPLGLNLQDIVGPVLSNPDPSYTPSYDPLIGMGNATMLEFPSKKNVWFSMIFILTYRPDPIVGLLSDPACAELLNVCGITSKRRLAKINYDAISTLDRVYLFGYKPTMSSSVSIGCPASEDQILEIRNDNATRIDPLRVLKRVLGNGTISFQ